MIFLSFLFKRNGNSWLASKAAAILFAVSSLFAIGLSPVLWGTINIPEHAGALENVGWGLLGIVGTLGTFFIWGGMWAYWTQCDMSRPRIKRVWFLVLLVGFWYGAILYYLLKYLPNELGRKPVRTAEEK